MIKNNKAQQILEYLAFFGAAVAVLISVAGPTGPFRDNVKQTINITLEGMNAETGNVRLELSCQNGVIDPGENCENCPEDVGACICGDGYCNGTEVCADSEAANSDGGMCYSDCGLCDFICGDGSCNGDEICVGASVANPLLAVNECGDCGDCCGNGTCDDGGSFAGAPRPNYGEICDDGSGAAGICRTDCGTCYTLDPYFWSDGNWAPSCSQCIPAAGQNKYVSCIEQATGQIVDVSNCNPADQPPCVNPGCTIAGMSNLSLIFNRDCPTGCYHYAWEPTTWTVDCYKYVDTVCTVTPCAVGICVDAGLAQFCVDTSEVVTCGGGKILLTDNLSGGLPSSIPFAPRCQRLIYNAGSGNWEVDPTGLDVNPNLCGAEPSETLDGCNEPCSPTPSGQIYEWFETGIWSTCTAFCDIDPSDGLSGGVQTQEVYCREAGTNTRVDDMFCDGTHPDNAIAIANGDPEPYPDLGPKPNPVRDCNEQPCCGDGIIYGNSNPASPYVLEACDPGDNPSPPYPLPAGPIIPGGCPDYTATDPLNSTGDIFDHGTLACYSRNLGDASPCTVDTEDCYRCGDGELNDSGPTGPFPAGDEICEHDGSGGFIFAAGITDCASAFPGHVPPYIPSDQHGLGSQLRCQLPVVGGEAASECTYDAVGCLYCGDNVYTDPPEICDYVGGVAQFGGRLCETELVPVGMGGDGTELFGGGTLGCEASDCSLIFDDCWRKNDGLCEFDKGERCVLADPGDNMDCCCPQENLVMGYDPGGGELKSSCPFLDYTGPGNEPHKCGTDCGTAFAPPNGYCGEPYYICGLVGNKADWIWGNGGWPGFLPPEYCSACPCLPAVHPTRVDGTVLAQFDDGTPSELEVDHGDTGYADCPTGYTGSPERPCSFGVFGSLAGLECKANCDSDVPVPDGTCGTVTVTDTAIHGATATADCVLGTRGDVNGGTCGGYVEMLCDDGSWINPLTDPDQCLEACRNDIFYSSHTSCGIISILEDGSPAEEVDADCNTGDGPGAHVCTGTISSQCDPAGSGLWGPTNDGCVEGCTDQVSYNEGFCGQLTGNDDKISGESVTLSCDSAGKPCTGNVIVTCKAGAWDYASVDDQCLHCGDNVLTQPPEDCDYVDGVANFGTKTCETELVTAADGGGGVELYGGGTLGCNAGDCSLIHDDCWRKNDGNCEYDLGERCDLSDIMDNPDCCCKRTFVLMGEDENAVPINYLCPVAEYMGASGPLTACSLDCAKALSPNNGYCGDPEYVCDLVAGRATWVQTDVGTNPICTPCPCQAQMLDTRTTASPYPPFDLLPRLFSDGSGMPVSHGNLGYADCPALWKGDPDPSSTRLCRFGKFGDLISECKAPCTTDVTVSDGTCGDVLITDDVTHLTNATRPCAEGTTGDRDGGACMGQVEMRCNDGAWEEPPAGANQCYQACRADLMVDTGTSCGTLNITQDATPGSPIFINCDLGDGQFASLCSGIYIAVCDINGSSNWNNPINMCVPGCIDPISYDAGSDCGILTSNNKAGSGSSISLDCDSAGGPCSGRVSVPCESGTWDYANVSDGCIWCGDGDCNGNETLNSCEEDCTVCGDTYITGSEQCDDGGTVPGDGCDENCQLEDVYIYETQPIGACSQTICLDGTQEQEVWCKNTTNNQYTTADYCNLMGAVLPPGFTYPTLVRTYSPCTTGCCGDNDRVDPEQCDQGAANGTPCPTPAYGTTCTYCDRDCTLESVAGPSCGDGTHQYADEDCDYQLWLDNAENTGPNGPGIRCENVPIPGTNGTSFYASGSGYAYCSSTCELFTDECTTCGNGSCDSAGSIVDCLEDCHCGDGNFQESMEECDPVIFGPNPKLCNLVSAEGMNGGKGTGNFYGSQTTFCQANCVLADTCSGYCGDDICQLEFNEPSTCLQDCQYQWWKTYGDCIYPNVDACDLDGYASRTSYECHDMLNDITAPTPWENYCDPALEPPLIQNCSADDPCDCLPTAPFTETTNFPICSGTVQIDQSRMVDSQVAVPCSDISNGENCSGHISYQCTATGWVKLYDSCGTCLNNQINSGEDCDIVDGLIQFTPGNSCQEIVEAGGLRYAGGEFGCSESCYVDYIPPDVLNPATGLMGNCWFCTDGVCNGDEDFFNCPEDCPAETCDCSGATRNVVSACGGYGPGVPCVNVDPPAPPCGNSLHEVCVEYVGCTGNCPLESYILCEEDVSCACPRGEEVDYTSGDCGGPGVTLTTTKQGDPTAIPPDIITPSCPSSCTGTASYMCTPSGWLSIGDSCSAVCPANQDVSYESGTCSGPGITVTTKKEGKFGEFVTPACPMGCNGTVYVLCSPDGWVVAGEGCSPVCGDGIVQGTLENLDLTVFPPVIENTGEVCDPGDGSPGSSTIIDGLRCQDLTGTKYHSGEFTCLPDCSGVDFGANSCKYCGDGICQDGDPIGEDDYGEDYSSCPEDCWACPDSEDFIVPGCGDASVAKVHVDAMRYVGASMTTGCPGDCATSVGGPVKSLKATCQADGSFLWEHDQCLVCGDGTCDPGEDHDNCSQDCHCGNNICEDGNGVPDHHENPITCPPDCSDVPGCGDGVWDEEDEACDINLASMNPRACDTIMSPNYNQVYYEGNGHCLNDCSGYDWSECWGWCGDGICQDQNYAAANSTADYGERPENCGDCDAFSCIDPGNLPEPIEELTQCSPWEVLTADTPVTYDPTCSSGVPCQYKCNQAAGYVYNLWSMECSQCGNGSLNSGEFCDPGNNPTNAHQFIAGQNCIDDHGPEGPSGYHVGNYSCNNSCTGKLPGNGTCAFCGDRICQDGSNSTNDYEENVSTCPEDCAGICGDNSFNSGPDEACDFVDSVPRFVSPNCADTIIPPSMGGDGIATFDGGTLICNAGDCSLIYTRCWSKNDGVCNYNGGERCNTGDAADNMDCCCSGAVKMGTRDDGSDIMFDCPVTAYDGPASTTPGTCTFDCSTISPVDGYCGIPEYKCLDVGGQAEWVKSWDATNPLCEPCPCELNAEAVLPTRKDGITPSALFHNGSGGKVDHGKEGKAGCPLNYSGPATRLCEFGAYGNLINECTPEVCQANQSTITDPAGCGADYVLDSDLASGVSREGQPCPGNCVGTLDLYCFGGTLTMSDNDCHLPRMCHRGDHVTVAGGVCDDYILPDDMNSDFPITGLPCPGEQCVGQMAIDCNDGTVTVEDSQCRLGRDCPAGSHISLSGTPDGCGPPGYTLDELLPHGRTLAGEDCTGTCTEGTVDVSCNDGSLTLSNKSCHTPGCAAGAILPDPASCGAGYTLLADMRSSATLDDIACPGICTGTMDVNCSVGTASISDMRCSSAGKCGTSTALDEGNCQTIYPFSSDVVDGTTVTNVDCGLGCSGRIDVQCMNGSATITSGSCTAQDECTNGTSYEFTSEITGRGCGTVSVPDGDLPVPFGYTYSPPEGCGPNCPRGWATLQCTFWESWGITSNNCAELFEWRVDDPGSCNYPNGCNVEGVREGFVANCYDAGRNSQVDSSNCDPADKPTGAVCPAEPCPTCSDTSMNGTETGIDCGGSCPNQDCCTNGYKDANLLEEGVDCGTVCAAVCPGYAWQVQWQGCPVPCGGGTETGTHECISQSGNPVSVAFCGGEATRPADQTRPCNEQTCVGCTWTGRVCGYNTTITRTDGEAAGVLDCHSINSACHSGADVTVQACVSGSMGAPDISACRWCGDYRCADTERGICPGDCPPCQEPGACGTLPECSPCCGDGHCDRDETEVSCLPDCENVCRGSYHYPGSFNCPETKDFNIDIQNNTSDGSEPCPGDCSGNIWVFCANGVPMLGSSCGPDCNERSFFILGNSATGDNFPCGKVDTPAGGLAGDGSPYKVSCSNIGVGQCRGDITISCVRGQYTVTDTCRVR